jgi:hypothetical protein
MMAYIVARSALIGYAEHPTLQELANAIDHIRVLEDLRQGTETQEVRNAAMDDVFQMEQHLAALCDEVCGDDDGDE